MTDIIERMAHLDVPNDLLGTVDVDEVLNRFRRAFRRLDDLKQFRTEHERRNAVMRWWNNDELENAQLDAQEVQAEFSKTLGQLMVISMLQARKLDGQQRQLATQQTEIRMLSERIGDHASTLAAEHARLFEQGEELKRLVRDALDIQYSMETERKLIAIASQVAKSRDALVSAFDEKLVQADGMAEQTRRLAAESFERITSSVEQRTAVLEAKSIERIAALEQQTAIAMSQVEQGVQVMADNLSTATTEQRGELKAAREEIGRLEQVVAGVLEAKAAERIGALEQQTAAAMSQIEQGVQAMADNLRTATAEQRGELKVAREEIGRLEQVVAGVLEAKAAERIGALEQQTAAAMSQIEQGVQAMEANLGASTTAQRMELKAAHEEIGRLDHVVAEMRDAMAAQQATIQEARQWAADQGRKMYLSIAAVFACVAVAIGIVYVMLV